MIIPLIDTPDNPIIEGVPLPGQYTLQAVENAFNGLGGLGCPGVTDCSCSHSEQQRGLITAKGNGLLGLGDLTDDIASSFSGFTSYLGSAADQVVNAVGGVELPSWLPYAAVGAVLLLMYRPGNRAARRKTEAQVTALRKKGKAPTVAKRIKRAVKSF